MSNRQQRSKLRIALDIGNGYAKAALVDRGNLACLRRETVPTADACENLPAIIGSLAGSAGRREAELDIVVASVVDHLRENLERALHAPGRRLHWVHYHPSLGFSVPYAAPATLGADRVANLLYCSRIFPAQDTVVVSAGTALTVDCLAGGSSFVGGAIMPGLEVQFHSLASSTAQLPLVGSAAHSPPWYGTSTESCIHVGVVRGAAGAVSRLVADQRAHSSPAAHVVVTGGAWSSLAELVDFDYQYIGEMTLLGAALYESDNSL